MSLHSFRLKIALLSGLITGLLLVGTGVVLWRISYQFNLSRLDREILDLGQGNLDREYGPVHYQRFEGALAFILGQDPPRSILTLVRDQQDKVIFVSPHWPTNLSAASFSALRSPLLPQSGPPRESRDGAATMATAPAASRWTTALAGRAAAGMAAAPTAFRGAIFRAGEAAAAAKSAAF